MHNLDLLLTLTYGLSAALVFGYVTQRLGLSSIVGYLLAGIAVGPYTPGPEADANIAQQMSEIGVVLLMFGVGLHFDLKDLLAVRRIAIPGAIAQSLVATGLGALAAVWFGWGWSAGVVFGLAISVASTVVLTRVLSDNNELHTPVGHVAVGWLIVEDLFTVVVLVLLPAMAGGGAEPGKVAVALGLALLKIGVLMAFVFLVGGRVVPWLLECAAAARSRELFTLTTLVVALGIAVGSAVIFGVSVALGAFLAGMIVGRSEYSLRAASEALPMRDAFAVLFFVAVGMLFDPRAVLDSPWLVLATVAIVMLGKPLAALAIVLLWGHPVRVALAVAVALAQIGEFSFILADLGGQLGFLPEGAMPVLIATAIISISLNPLLFRILEPLEAAAARRPRLWAWLNARTRSLTNATAEVSHGQSDVDPRYRAVIVGYGPVGQTLTRLLRENEIQPTIIELNIETIRRLHEQKIPAVYGDANHRETLSAAGVEHAATLILSASGLPNSEEVIRTARQLNSNLQVIVRSAYLRERATLRKAGADQVFSGEGEVALAMTEYILRDLGATPDQIDRERDRLEADLFGGKTS